MTTTVLEVLGQQRLAPGPLRRSDDERVEDRQLVGGGEVGGCDDEVTIGVHDGNPASVVTISFAARADSPSLRTHEAWVSMSTWVESTTSSRRVSMSDAAVARLAGSDASRAYTITFVSRKIRGVPIRR